jgi:tRNA A37 threonylcarbamoyladenosine biosynthesis protein TsaE
LTFVEWAERVAACLPAERLEVRISLPPGTALGDGPRRFEIADVGRRYESILERLCENLSRLSACTA